VSAEPTLVSSSEFFRSESRSFSCISSISADVAALALVFFSALDQSHHIGVSLIGRLSVFQYWCQPDWLGGHPGVSLIGQVAILV
jgi:hypothetical protein